MCLCKGRSQSKTGDLLVDLLREIAFLWQQTAIGPTNVDRHPATPQIIDWIHPSLYAYEKGLTMVLLEATSGGAHLTQMHEWSSFTLRKQPNQQQGVMIEETGNDQGGSSSKPLPAGLESCNVVAGGIWSIGQWSRLCDFQFYQFLASH